MNKFVAQQVMSGTQGEVWIDGKYMAEVTAFKAEIKLIKEEVNQVKTMSKQYKVTGWEGTGNVKMNHVSSYFINLMADNIRNARQTVATIRVKLDDPDAVGREEVIIRDATFDKLTLMDWEAKKLTEDDYDFTFTDYEVPVTADA
ncbi:phage tail tube protein [Megamonas funiformis]|uniref:phage tail tube protein n=1 Tax=Megamonas funiformis TaxID=437897 RepID=UPI002052D0C6|nr:phage tail tube protein [Megamonas funiformis]DAR31471.1 MAG TPA: tail tube protein [Caudoviricetes sp.]